MIVFLAATIHIYSDSSSHYPLIVNLAPQSTYIVILAATIHIYCESSSQYPHVL